VYGENISSARSDAQVVQYSHAAATAESWRPKEVSILLMELDAYPSGTSLTPCARELEPDSYRRMFVVGH
jgi:hypothetical protein